MKMSSTRANILEVPVAASKIKDIRIHFLRLELDYRTLATHFGEHPGFRGFETVNWVELDVLCANLYQEIKRREQSNIAAGHLQKQIWEHLQGHLDTLKTQLSGLRFRLEGHQGFAYPALTSYQLLGDPNTAPERLPCEFEAPLTSMAVKFSLNTTNEVAVEQATFRNNFYAKYNEARRATGIAPKGWWRA
jgi:hypothetical protein